MAATSSSRGSSWSDNEVRALISIWGEDNIQEELDGAVRQNCLCWDCEEDARVSLREGLAAMQSKEKILRTYIET